MEKLVLRGIMYGADKIPDTWFEKIPGGYYKSNDYDANAKSSPRHSQSRHRDSDRRDYDRRDRRRRYSNDYDYDRRRYDDDRRREDYRSRRSIDDRSGLDDRNQRRSYDYDRKDRPTSFDDQRPYDRAPSNRRMYESVNNRDERPISPLNTAAAGAAGGFAGAAANEELHPPQAPLNEKSTPGYTGYVPYSHIYGAANENQRPQQPFSPPPASSVGSVQPSSMNQMTTSRRNPMSIDGSVANGLITPINDFSPRAPLQHEYPQVDGNYEDWPEDRLPYRGRDRSRDRYSDLRSHSYDSRPSRARSERRNGDEKRERGKSMSKLKSTFDPSQRGVGYGAVGAIAGGLIGSGAGSGPGATATGAVLGGVLANMFEARERFVEPRRPLETQIQARNKDTGRKENARNVEFAKDTEMIGRREKRDRERRESTISS